MAYEQPPPFMPYEPFSLGVGVVFNLLKLYSVRCSFDAAFHMELPRGRKNHDSHRRDRI